MVGYATYLASTLFFLHDHPFYPTTANAFMAGGQNLRFNADACALGLLKAPSSLAFTSSSVTHWDRRTSCISFPTSLLLLGLPSDVIGVGLDVGGFPPSFLPPFTLLSTTKVH